MYFFLSKIPLLSDLHKSILAKKKIINENQYLHNPFLFNLKNAFHLNLLQNITVSRVKKERLCQISSLPRGLPRPDVLEKGLKLVSQLIHNLTLSSAVQELKVRKIRS